MSGKFKTLKSELKTELTTFKEEIKKEMKEELEDFMKNVNQKLMATANKLAKQTTRLDGAEQRVADVESWNMEVKDALLQALKQQRILQDRLTDQEGRNRRNNIRIFGLKEGVEGNSAKLRLQQFQRR